MLMNHSFVFASRRICRQLKSVAGNELLRYHRYRQAAAVSRLLLFRQLTICSKEQADRPVQNMNIMFGFNETNGTALAFTAIEWPKEI